MHSDVAHPPLAVHVDPITLMVITPEERTLPQLADEFIKYNTKFRPQHGLQVSETKNYQIIRMCNLQRSLRMNVDFSIVVWRIYSLVLKPVV